jgi:hypothetical protein
MYNNYQRRCRRVHWLTNLSIYLFTRHALYSQQRYILFYHLPRFSFSSSSVILYCSSIMIDYILWQCIYSRLWAIYLSHLFDFIGMKKLFICCSVSLRKQITFYREKIVLYVMFMRLCLSIEINSRELTASSITHLATD